MRKSEPSFQALSFGKKGRVIASESGQALIEYVLLIAITISLVTIMANGLRRSVFTLWSFYTRAVAAPCPGCPPPSGIN